MFENNENDKKEKEKRRHDYLEKNERSNIASNNLSGGRNKGKNFDLT